MARISILFLLIFCLGGWGQIGDVKGTIIKPNRSLILGKVEKVKKNFLSPDRVQVIIELLPEFKEVKRDYQMVVEGTTNRLIKALVPVDQRGSLVKDPSVRFIRSPYKPILFPYFSTEPTRLNRSGIKKGAE